jgi:hypothetical protein
MFCHVLDDGRNLLGRFGFAEDYLRNSLTQGTVVVDHGDAGIFERKLAQALEALIDTEVASLHGGQ